MCFLCILVFFRSETVVMYFGAKRLMQDARPSCAEASLSCFCFRRLACGSLGKGEALPPVHIGVSTRACVSSRASYHTFEEGFPFDTMQPLLFLSFTFFQHRPRRDMRV